MPRKLNDLEREAQYGLGRDRMTSGSGNKLPWILITILIIVIVVTSLK